MPLSCTKCGHINRDGARFCAECGAPLTLVCTSCGAALSATAKFCDACGAASGATSPPELVTRKVVTVVFADLAGSTALQEQLDPESARRVMTRFYEQMRAVLEAHGGHLEKFIGDAVVTLFGRPVVREDDALRAVRASAAMVAALESLNAELEKTWGVRLRMRTGVNTGELVLSDAGALVGDTMNTAARLEQAAREGEVLVGEPTWRLVHHAVELEEVEPLTVKGKSGALRAWRVTSVPAMDQRRAAAVETPLVGRQGELGRLRVAYGEAVSARACRLVTVIGSPGVGKSRLAREFGASVAEVAAVVEGHCEPTGEGIPFLPVAEILRSVADIGETDPADVVQDKLRALSSSDDPDRERLVARAAGVLGVVEQASAQETFWALRRGVEFLARERPLVLMLDDLHWGQPMLLDLVEHLVEWVDDAPVLVIALARPELRDAREALVSAGRRPVEVIELEPLDERESLQLVDGLLGEVRVPAPFRDRILEVTEGNPLFLGETLRMLVDEGLLRHEGEAWVASDELAAVEVPPTIQALLAARIERLRADERSVVERASVIGKQFYRGAVAELVAPPVAVGIDGHLEALRRKDMVEPEGTYWIDEPVYRFHHVLIRDAAYRSLLKEARSELHERFADWLQAKAGELAGEHEEVIAFHLEQAHEYRRELGPLDDRGRELGLRAAERLLSAGRRALAREDLAAAQNLLRRALARGAGDPAEIMWDLCDAVLSAGDTTAAADLVARYADVAAGNLVRGARAQVLQGQLANLTGAPAVGATVDELIAAAALLGEHEDRAGEARAHQTAAGAYARLGQVGAVEEALDKALAAARAAGDRRRTTAVLAAAPRAALWGPSPVVRASGRCLDVVRILRMTPGNRHVEAIALRCQAVLEAMRGRHQAAREILAAGRTTLEELGLGFQLNETAVHAGIVELLADDPAAACEHLRAARAGFEALGAVAGAAGAAALLARALVARGDAEASVEASAQTEYAEAHSGEDLKTVITGTSARAEALAQTGEIEEALTLARRAMALAEPTDALTDKGDAAMALSRVLLAAGHEDEAREAIRSAAGWYEAKGHTVGVELAANLIGGEPLRTASVPASSPGAAAVAGEPAPERFWREFKRRFDAHDLDGLLELFDEDWVSVDHRTLGWEEIRGRENQAAGLGSAFAASPDVHVDRLEVLACDERVIAQVGAWRGTTSDGGGQVEIPFGVVTVVQDGRRVSDDFYEPDDRESMLQRFTELSARPSVLGDRAPERHELEWIRRWAAGDLDALMELYAEDWVLRDHRAVSMQADINDRAELRAHLEVLLEGALEVRLDVDEVIACDERVMAHRVAWRGTARDGGGVFEVPLGFVAVKESGREVSLDQYDSENRRAMIARYAELGGGLAALGDRPPERWFARLANVQASQDHTHLPGLYAEGYALVDHRNVGWNPTTSRAEAVERIEAIWAGSTDVRLEVAEVMGCDDRVIALRLAWEGGVKAESGGGRFTFPLCVVVVVDDGEAVRWEQYEPEDRKAALARYAELGGRAVPGQRPPERHYAEWIRRWDSRDLDALMELYAEDWVLREHRGVSTMEDVNGRDEARVLLASILRDTLKVRLDIDEVLACDDRVIATQVAWRGTGRDGGGEFEAAVGFVTVIEAGREVSVDQYDPEDRVAMIARYSELGGGLAALGDRPPERWFAQYARLYAARELEQLLEISDFDSWETIDHRNAGWDPVRGREAAAAMNESTWAGTLDHRVEVDEVLACDERVIALRISMPGTAVQNAGGGKFEVLIGVVAVVEADQLLRWEMFEPEDRKAMLARYGELAGRSLLGDKAPERFYAEWILRWDSRDLDSLSALYAEDWVMTEHRPLAAMEEVQGSDGRRRLFESIIAAAADARFEIDEVLACDERVIALRGTWRGTAQDGGGPLEVGCAIVSVVEGGRQRRIDVFGPDETQRVIALYAELGGGQAPLGDRPPERFWAELARRWATLDEEAIVALYAEDWTAIDHRQLGWEKLRGHEAARSHVRSGVQSCATFRHEFDEVLACDDRVIALVTRILGTSVEGGGSWEIAYGCVSVVDDGVLARRELFDPDARQAMLSRFAELSAAAPRSRAEVLHAMAVERYNAHDLEGLMSLYDEHVAFVDHRQLAWVELHGADQVGPFFGSGFEAASDIRWEVPEILASDDATIALRLLVRGTEDEHGGEFELTFAYVSRYAGEKIVSTDFYDAEDRRGLIARYAELGGGQAALGDRPPERFWAEFCRRWATQEVEAIAELYDDHWVAIEHRQLGWEEMSGREHARKHISSVLEDALDVRCEVDEVLACDHRTIALTATWRGSSRRVSSGTWENSYGYVVVVEGGRLTRLERYEPDQRGAMLTRYEELCRPDKAPEL